MASKHIGGMAPLASCCSLCAEGYHPNLAIDVADEPMERQYGDDVGFVGYRWCHEECRHDHGRIFLGAFEENDALRENIDRSSYEILTGLEDLTDDADINLGGGQGP